ncbi:MAG: acyltransferase [Desulfobacteraceae bacterium]|nr:MAG: acyltransferase [Desulfobacteraceae bacterium]
MSGVNKNPDQISPIYKNIDSLKGVAIIIVLTYHTGLYESKETLFGIFRLTHLIYSDLIFLGVPLFFLISMFLFSLKLREDRSYFIPRLKTLIYSYIFWVTLWILIHYGGFKIINLLLTLPLKKLFYFLSGEGIGIFYFHFSLILLLIISYLSISFPRPIIFLLLLISVMYIFILPFIKLSEDPFFASFWSPFNFFPYAFIGLLLSEYIQSKHFSLKHIKMIILFLTIPFLLFVAQEWYCHLRGIYQITEYPYMRASVIFGASILFIASFLLKRRIMLLERISDYAMGIYCLQLFAINAYWTIVNFNQNSIITILLGPCNSASRFGPCQGGIRYSLFIFVICLIGTIFLKKVFSKKII